MDQRERLNDPHESFKLILDGRQLRMWTSLPGIIQKFYPDKQTVDVQPAIMGIVTDAGGNTKNVNIPKLLDCPVQFPSGGGGGTTGQQSVGGSTGNVPSTSNVTGLSSSGGLGGLGNLGGINSGNINNSFSNSGIGGIGGGIGGVQQYGVTLTFPVQPGDECLIVFTSRGFDNWWQSGGIQPPMEARMHDLSDGFVFLGFRSQPRKLSNVSTTTCQLRSDDGVTLVELDAKNQTVNIRDNANVNHIVLDIKNQKVNVTAQKQIELQDNSGSNYIKFDTVNQNVDIVMQGQITLQASQINIKGPVVQSNGGITGSTDVQTSSGISLDNHVHPGVQTGPGTTGTPQG